MTIKINFKNPENENFNLILEYEKEELFNSDINEIKKTIESKLNFFTFKYENKEYIIPSKNINQIKITHPEEILNYTLQNLENQKEKYVTEFTTP